jgi:solute:Na+ symporter, SSS family
VLFGDLSNTHLVISICGVAVIASLYTMLGGIGAVIWTDALQLLIVVGSALVCVVLLIRHIGMPLSDIVSVIQQSTATDGSSKLTLIDTRVDPQVTFTLWTSIIGFTLISIAAYGTDQDLTQRLLTCKSTAHSRAATIISPIIGIFVTSIFLVLGLLLFVWYSMQSTEHVPLDTRQIFLRYILDEIPPGLKGLMLVGIFAAAMSSLDSALNAMSAVLTRDILGRTDADHHSVHTARLGVLAITAILTATACGFVFLQQRSGDGLLSFALGVMTYAHSGLLAVFACALFTKRGTTASVIAAFGTGITVAVVLQFFVHDDQGTPWLSIGWRMTAASLAAFFVCILGSAKIHPQNQPQNA